MNPVLEDILSFFHDRRPVTGINLEPFAAGRRRVVFALSDGTSEAREYECDQATFLEWWEQATEHLQSAAEAFLRVADA